MSEENDWMARQDREAAEREQRAEQERTQYRPEDFVYDASLNMFWNIHLNRPFIDKVVDNMIPQSEWERMERPPMRNGTPRPPQLIRPSITISRIEMNQTVESSTWWPGRPMIIPDMYVGPNGPRYQKGARCYNSYRARPTPMVPAGVTAQPFIDHVKRLYPKKEEHEFLFDLFAHAMQRPEEKFNGYVCISGEQGIGKDAMLDAMRIANGSQNFRNIDPDQLVGRFKPFLETIILVVDEVRQTREDHGSISMYNVMKPLTACPPELLAVEDKGLPIRYVLNRVRLIATANSPKDLYVPKNDRRGNFLHSHLRSNWHIAAGDPEYFVRFWGWLKDGGGEALASWLLERDISKFNPKASQVKTDMWQEVSNSWSSGGEGDMLEAVLDGMGMPDVVIGGQLIDQHNEKTDFDLAKAMKQLLSQRKFLFKMEDLGYRLVVHPLGHQKWRFLSRTFMVPNKETNELEEQAIEKRTRTVFVRNDLIWTRDEMISAIDAAGFAWAEQARKETLRAMGRGAEVDKEKPTQPAETHQLDEERSRRKPQ